MSHITWTPPHRLARRLAAGAVDLVTGKPLLVATDLVVPSPVPILWRRCWGFDAPGRDGGLGAGVRHGYDRTLRLEPDALVYTDQHGLVVRFPRLERDEDRATRRGLLLERIESRRYRLVEAGQPTVELRFSDLAEPAHVHSIVSGQGWLRLQRRSSGRLVRLDASDGSRVELEWRDEHIWQVRLVPEGGRAPRAVTYGYDEQGRLVFVDRSGEGPTRLAYDARHRLVAVAGPGDRVVRLGWADDGRCVAVDDHDPARYEHFPEAGQVAVTRADGARWIATHDGRDVTHLASPEGEVTRWRYDEAGDLLSEEEPDGTLWQVERHWTGGVARLHAAGRARDPRDDASADRPALTTLERELGALVSPPGTLPDRYALPPRLPSAFLRAVETVEGLDGGMPSLETDAEGRAVAFVHRGGAEWRCARDAHGAMTWIATASRGRWEADRDPWGRVAALRGPRSALVQVERDGRGRVVVVSLADGRRAEVERDGAGRPTAIRLPRAGLALHLCWTDGGATLEFRDGAARLLSERRWGAAGLLRLRRLASSGEEETYRWDDQARLVGAASPAGEIELRHDPMSGKLAADLRDGRGVERVFRGARGSTTTVLDRFETTTERLDGVTTRVTTPTGAHVKVRHHKLGLVTIEHEGGLVELRQYAPGGGCLAAALGHRDRPEEARPLGAPRPLGEALGAGAAQVERDERGRARLVRAGANMSMRWLAYDDLDRLVEVRWSDGRRWSARWDALDRLVAVVEPDGTTRQLWWDGARLAAEQAGEDGPLHLYVYPDDQATLPRVVVSYRSRWSRPEDGRPFVLLYDASARPVEARDSEGRVVWALGEQAPGEAGWPLRQPLLGQGFYHEHAAGLVFDGARAWDVQSGCFLQPVAPAVGRELRRQVEPDWPALLGPERELGEAPLPPLEPEAWPEVVEAVAPRSLAHDREALAAILARMARLLERDRALAERFTPDLRQLEQRLEDAVHQASQPSQVAAAPGDLDHLRASIERLAARLASTAEVEEESLTQELSQRPWLRFSMVDGPPRMGAAPIKRSDHDGTSC